MLVEITEAQQTAQLERPSGTQAAREIMQIGVDYHGVRRPKEALLSAVRNATENIPKNMHPMHDVERRKCRAEAILKNHGRRDGALFVDAAR